jgi:hypothetical protein
MQNKVLAMAAAELWYNHDCAMVEFSFLDSFLRHHDARMSGENGTAIVPMHEFHVAEVCNPVSVGANW